MIIAEAGVNHNGDLEQALALVDAAADAGADIVKFQTFRADRLSTRRAQKAAYQKAQTGAGEGQYEMLSRLELSESAHHTLLERSHQRGLEFLSTPFDPESLRFLTSELGLQRLKIGSGDLTNAPLLLEAARSSQPTILSTGMGTMAEIEAALGVLAFGYSEEIEAPGRAAFARAYADRSRRALLRDKVILLHCTTEYPAPIAETNLRAITTLSTAFGLPTGFSDHTKGIAVATAAVALGACSIEKHFTLDRGMDGPDHAASLEPAELAQMVAAIRSVEAALGDGVKARTPSEAGNAAIARKGLVAAQPIAKGELFSASNIAVKRPEDGYSPYDFWDLIGVSASRDYEADECL